MSSENASVKVGWFAGPVNVGIKNMRHQMHETRKEMNEEWGVGKLLAFGAIVEGIHSIMEEAHELDDLSKRFGVLGSDIQRITNASKLDGGGPEKTAAALNKMLVNQVKAKEGNEEMIKALGDLGIAADEFINLGTDEAFYKIADAVHDAKDPLIAYHAVVTLMGKSAGELIPTLQRGSAEIRRLGEASGVMSDQTIEKLTEASNKWTSVMHIIKVKTAETFIWVAKAVETVGAYIGLIINTMREGWTSTGEEAKKVFSQQFKEIWHPDEEKKEKPEPRDMDETKDQIHNAEELEKLYEKIGDQQRERHQAALTAEERLNDLVEERNELYAKAAAMNNKPKEQAELWIKAGEVEKKIVEEREKADKTFEEKMKKIEEARKQFQKKEFDNDLEAMSREDQLKALLQERMGLDKQIASETDIEQAYKLMAEREELSARIKKTQDKEDDRKLIVSSIGRLSGGGAYLAKNDPTDKQVRAVEAGNKLLQDVKTTLGKIEEKTGKPVWQP